MIYTRSEDHPQYSGEQENECCPSRMTCWLGGLPEVEGGLIYVNQDNDAMVRRAGVPELYSGGIAYVHRCTHKYTEVESDKLAHRSVRQGGKVVVKCSPKRAGKAAVV